MDKIILSEVCRVCANKIKDKKRQCHIFNYMRGKLLQNLKLITGVELLANDCLPNFICDRCSSELDLAVKFRERCIFSQNYLQDMLKKKCTEFKTPVKELSEELIDEDQLEYVDQDDDSDFEIYRAQDYSCEPNEEIVEDVTVEEVIEEETEEAEEEAANQNKRHFVLLQESHPVKRLRNFFICEDCGEYFKLENEYKDHLAGHEAHRESIQLYPCFQCPLSFNTKTKLERHLRNVHNGNRLFTCNTCGEIFLEHAAKQRHEIAHVNERPYPCLECGMIFSSVSELRLHAATHSQRTFRCEPCNRNFTTPNQLDMHSNTYSHKSTVQQMQEEIEMMCETSVKAGELETEGEADEELEEDDDDDEELEEEDDDEQLEYV